MRLEEGIPEAVDIKDGNGDSAGAGGWYGPERIQQRAMKNWLQGKELQARQGEEVQMLQLNVGENKIPKLQLKGQP